MANSRKFKILRGLLRSVGLSKESVNDVVDWVSNLIHKDNDTDIPFHFALLKSDVNDVKQTKEIHLPYARRDDFLSPAELSFYRVLRHTLNEQAIIFVKVGLGDIFYVKSKDRSEYHTFLNKIDRKHIDFLLCDPDMLQPICGVELDDKSHNRKDRQERDRFVNAVFEISKLPIVHIPVSSSYVTSDLYEYFRPYLKSNHVSKLVLSEPEYETVIKEETPSCPKCGSEMILRTAKKGKNVGEKFWGCSNYPKCHAIIKITNDLE